MIPRILHQFWLGPNPRPDRLMAGWRALHPDWEYRLWTSETEREPGIPWRLQSQIDRMKEWNGKADVLRYSVLHEFGGIAIDADMEALLPLPDSMLEHRAVACWENETVAPRMVACGFLGCEPGSPLMADVLATIEQRSACPWPVWPHEPAWRLVGPLLFSEVARRHKDELKIFPAAAFLPEHHSGVPPRPYDGPRYARHYWGSTIGSKHHGYRGLT